MKERYAGSCLNPFHPVARQGTRLGVNPDGFSRAQAHFCLNPFHPVARQGTNRGKKMNKRLWALVLIPFILSPGREQKVDEIMDAQDSGS
jgi:hypothetical protein